MRRPWLDILLDKMKKSYKSSKILEIDGNILCLHTQIKNYSDDELGRFNGAYTFDGLCFFDLECTQENANKVIEKFCSIALGRDNHRLIKINELTMLVRRDDPRLNKPRVISFKYVRNEQSGCRITCNKQRFKEILTQFLQQNNIKSANFDELLEAYECDFRSANLNRNFDIDYHVILECIHAMEWFDIKNQLITEMAKILYDAIDDKIQSLKDIQTHYKHEYLGQNYIPAITKEDLQKLLYNHRKYQIKTELWIESCHFFPRVICNDGFSFSAQVHCNYPCEPKEELAYWESMDLYFLSDEELLLNKYLSAFNGLLKDTYRCVPMHVIVDIINKHGGMKNIEDFRGE